MAPKEILGELLRRGGCPATEAVMALADKPVDQLPDELQGLENVGQFALLGFMDAGTDGYEFIARERILTRFGNTIAGNYPEAGPVFLRFANSYWTLKLALQEASGARGSLAHLVLGEVERVVAALFFPTPGPVQIPVAKRAADQRAFLEASAPRMSIEEFISHNPILKRDAQSQSSGCVGALLLWAGAAGLAGAGLL